LETFKQEGFYECCTNNYLIATVYTYMYIEY